MKTMTHWVCFNLNQMSFFMNVFIFQADNKTLDGQKHQLNQLNSK